MNVPRFDPSKSRSLSPTFSTFPPVSIPQKVVACPRLSPTFPTFPRFPVPDFPDFPRLSGGTEPRRAAGKYIAADLAGDETGERRGSVIIVRLDLGYGLRELRVSHWIKASCRKLGLFRQFVSVGL